MVKQFKQETVPRHGCSCGRCGSIKVGLSRNFEYVCFDCGRVHSPSYEFEITSIIPKKKTYKRIFYFNERCSRWCCLEPKIADDIWELIYNEAQNPKYAPITNCGREKVSKILRNVSITELMQEKHRSKKFKCNPLTPKRFYDKYFEKWKTISSKLSGKEAVIPPQWLVNEVKRMFAACLHPFELFRHGEDCDGKHRCDRRCSCIHNILNYDFLFRKYFQIIEIRTRRKGLYARYKDDFPLVSLNIREKKLRPIFFKICKFRFWPKIVGE